MTSRTRIPGCIFVSVVLEVFIRESELGHPLRNGVLYDDNSSRSGLAEYRFVWKHTLYKGITEWRRSFTRYVVSITPSLFDPNVY